MSERTKGRFARIATGKAVHVATTKGGLNPLHNGGVRRDRAMANDLIERAREAAESAPNRELLFDLADRIEALQAENARLREARASFDWVERECYGLFPEGDEDDGFLGYAVTRGKSVMGSGPTIDDAIADAQKRRAALQQDKS